MTFSGIACGAVSWFRGGIGAAAGFWSGGFCAPPFGLPSGGGIMSGAAVWKSSYWSGAERGNSTVAMLAARMEIAARECAAIETVKRPTRRGAAAARIWMTDVSNMLPPELRSTRSRGKAKVTEA